ncbi:MAG: hypothetical protein E6G54_08355 [Actinobacteria bacterium]|nr:MAG: hypothetical protein E6G54_08355 [Actinomycetota bacterium]
MLVEEAQGESQHVLEVESAHRPFAAFVPVVDPEHQLRRDRRLVVAELGTIPSRRDHPVLGPFDLVRELAPREELVRWRQGVREGGDERSLVVQHFGERLPGVRGPQPREL